MTSTTDDFRPDLQLESALIPMQQVGKLLPISRSSIYELIEKGTLHRVKIGHRAFITRASIDAFVNRIIGQARD